MDFIDHIMDSFPQGRQPYWECFKGDTHDEKVHSFLQSSKEQGYEIKAFTKRGVKSFLVWESGENYDADCNFLVQLDGDWLEDFPQNDLRWAEYEDSDEFFTVYHVKMLKDYHPEGYEEEWVNKGQTVYATLMPSRQVYLS
ncbi:hypothetical protein, partial [Streptococcus pseudopneumoniae]|uniref:hypothetical protein n=1 Tax=Streptococcus pseudopneumoniae TaxID=257758 RepID=UPI00110C26DD